MIPPSEIFRDPYVRQLDEVQYWGYSTPLETMLESLDAITTHESLFDLDAQRRGIDSPAYYASVVLGKLPPELIYEHYGEEGLIFVVCHASSLVVGEKFQEALHKFGGYDSALFDKARLWAWQKYNTADCREVLAQYAVIEKVTDGWLGTVDLPAILRECAQPGVVISDRRADDYSLMELCSSDSKYEPAGYDRNWSRDITPELRYSIWLDTPSGFTLGYKGMPQSIAALECVNQRELMISQLQGVRAKILDPAKKYASDEVIGRASSRGLAPLDWQRVMVAVAAELAQHLGLSALAIQGGENNIWRTKRLHGETEPHITAETAAKAYDIPAMRLGFMASQDGNWHINLP